MKYGNTTKEQLIDKLSKLRQRIAELEASETKNKRMKEMITSSEERLRILFEYAPDGYYLNDTKGTFIDGNKAAEELVGYKKEELIGKSFLKLKLLSPKQVTKAAKLLAKNVLGQPTGPDEFILNRKDGKQVTVEIRTFPVKIKDQNLVLGIARDITERKKTEMALTESESKLREQKLALEQKNIALREVIAQIEIEKRRIKDNIENNVNMVVSPILEKLKIRKDSHKYVNLLRHHLERLASQYGSKIAKSNFKLTPREIEVCNMVKGGLTSKDISNFLNISGKTVDKHRENIRHKLGIHNKGINLTSFLREL
jgi:PAS domain S-box-containing protein